jgi:hypothetical protein
MKNPWIEYNYTTPNQVHPSDQQGFTSFNERVSTRKNADRLTLSSHNTALPYFGSLDAKLVILAANPGLDPDKTPEEETPERRRLFDRARKHELTDNPFVFLRDEFSGTAGFDWWTSRTRLLREAMGDESFYRGAFSAEIHPYKSRNYQKLYEPLPTQQYTFDLVNELVRNGAWVILMRAKDEWRTAVPELRSSSRVIELNSAQSSYLTPGNMQAGVFDKLTRI